MLPKAVRDLSNELTKLPGIGPKTAERLALHLLRQPAVVVGQFAQTLRDLHASVKICKTCFNLSESEECAVCTSEMRDKELLCVVEDALDVEAFERTGAYNGLYHILGGVLSPLDGVGVDDLTVNELLERINDGTVKEVIIALDHKMESDATTRYILGKITQENVIITRLARGLPTGGDIEFADATTLSAAFTGRREV
jgi:recombination protein RecR